MYKIHLRLVGLFFLFGVLFCAFFKLLYIAFAGNIDLDVPIDLRCGILIVMYLSNTAGGLP